MAHSERTRHARKWALAASACLALLAAQPALTQTPSQIQQRTADTVYKLDYLANLAKLAQDQALQQWIKQQIAEELQELQSLEWQSYRRCEAMKNPTKGNDGDIYKWAEEEKHRNEAMKNLSGIAKIFGGVPSEAGAIMSATTGEAHGGAKEKMIDIAKDLSEGSSLSDLFNKLGPALAALDGGAQLYDTWQAVKLGSDAIDQRNAADAALTDCKKPPEHQELTQGTPYLRPFPPGSPPQPPNNSPPPQQPNPKPPTPHKPIPLGQFLQQALSARGHGG